MRSIVVIAAATLVAASVSGATEQPPEPISTAIPAPYFGAPPKSGPFSAADVKRRIRPLGATAPPWARHLYRRSVRALLAFTDPHTGALIAGARDGWEFVWPRDAAAGALALQAAGLHPEAVRVGGFLSRLDLADAARFLPDGERVPGRPEAGDAVGWVRAAERATGLPLTGSGPVWLDRQDYGENVTGDLLGNAVASALPAAGIAARFLTSRGLVRQQGHSELDSSASWAATLFPQPDLRGAVTKTLLTLAGESTAYGMAPIEGWTPGQVWTAPTAWSAWGLIELGRMHAADRLLRELRRAATPAGTLPERVDATTGEPTSTTPLAWSQAFAILALRARYPD
jgi:glucoamylase